MVHTTVKDNLVQAFAFERREFGQDVRQSEVIAAIQAVEGVVAVDLDYLYEGSERALHPQLVAETARWAQDAIQPAQMLRLNADDITLNQWEAG